MNKKIKEMQKDIEYLLEINEQMKQTNNLQIAINESILDILEEMKQNESK